MTITIAIRLTVQRHLGLAAYYAYRAYNASSAVQLMMTIWQLVIGDFVTEANAQQGALPRAQNFTSACTSTLAGGVFTVRMRCDKYAVRFAHAHNHFFSNTLRMPPLRSEQILLRKCKMLSYVLNLMSDCHRRAGCSCRSRTSRPPSCSRDAGWPA